MVTPTKPGHVDPGDPHQTASTSTSPRLGRRIVLLAAAIVSVWLILGRLSDGSPAGPAGGTATLPAATASSDTGPAGVPVEDLTALPVDTTPEPSTQPVELETAPGDGDADRLRPRQLLADPAVDGVGSDLARLLTGPLTGSMTEVSTQTGTRTTAVTSSGSRFRVTVTDADTTREIVWSGDRSCSRDIVEGSLPGRWRCDNSDAALAQAAVAQFAAASPAALVARARQAGAATFHVVGSSTDAIRLTVTAYNDTGAVVQRDSLTSTGESVKVVSRGPDGSSVTWTATRDLTARVPGLARLAGR